MQTTTCVHKEKIESGNGFQIGTCQICHQVRRYDTQNLHAKPRIIKLGRVNGMIILPADELLQLSPEVQAEINAAEKALVERPQLSSDSKVSQGNHVARRAPPRPQRRRQLSQYHEHNKVAILEDYQQLTLREFFAKWHICSASWGKLKKIWNVPNKQKARLGQGPPPSLEQLPPFPAFNENWTSNVQEKWLETYKVLKARR